mmetsp:Transcript_84730/g.263593  ORF Transcript_84730/g.263593 Transcript_84730/m.263593 type:complete len:239 (+) Transcript_84730:844-1560(+)
MLGTLGHGVHGSTAHTPILVVQALLHCCIHLEIQWGSASWMACCASDVGERAQPSDACPLTGAAAALERGPDCPRVADVGDLRHGRLCGELHSDVLVAQAQGNRLDGVVVVAVPAQVLDGLAPYRHVVVLCIPEELILWRRRRLLLHFLAAETAARAWQGMQPLEQSWPCCRCAATTSSRCHCEVAPGLVHQLQRSPGCHEASGSPATAAPHGAAGLCADTPGIASRGRGSEPLERLT